MHLQNLDKLISTENYESNPFVPSSKYSPDKVNVSNIYIYMCVA